MAVAALRSSAGDPAGQLPVATAPVHEFDECAGSAAVAELKGKLRDVAVDKSALPDEYNVHRAGVNNADVQIVCAAKMDGRSHTTERR